jgi:serine/threonine protein phosphatase PrpC
VALRIVEEAALTDVGRQRHANEDAYYDSEPFFAIADGMGGARAGEVAARIAVEEFDQDRDEDAAPEAQLERIARAANRKIHELSQEDESHSGMGTTLTAVRVGEQEVTIGHVGDSRIYLLRDGELERLTSDHSLVEQLVREGKLTPEQAEVHPQRSIITRALGPEPEVEVETLTYPARDGDVYLLCSDGLTSMVPEEEVAAILRRRSSLEQAARELVDAANRAGGRDNITVILVRLGRESEQAPAESDTLTGRETHAPTVIRRPEPEERLEAPAPRVAAPRRRRALAAAVATLVLGAAVVGLWVGSRQFYFVGTNDEGLVTLYRGLPYDLPLGIKLYDENYVSSVPATSVAKLGRTCLLDGHDLAGRGDRADLVRQLERGRLEPAARAC